VGGKIFCTPPNRPWGPPSILYIGYWVSFPGVKQPGRGVDHQPPPSSKVKERVELYLSSPYGPSWPVVGLIYLYYNFHQEQWRTGIRVTIKFLRQAISFVHQLLQWPGKSKDENFTALSLAREAFK
jgi:hypothetical protein